MDDPNIEQINGFKVEITRDSGGVEVVVLDTRLDDIERSDEADTLSFHTIPNPRYNMPQMIFSLEPLAQQDSFRLNIGYTTRIRQGNALAGWTSAALVEISENDYRELLADAQSGTLMEFEKMRTWLNKIMPGFLKLNLNSFKNKYREGN